MSKQPLCVCCGKKIAKRTEKVFFSLTTDPVLTYEEAKARTNKKITAHRWFKFWNDDRMTRVISDISVWDGESYVDPFFCNGTCAKEFAYAAARTGMKMGGRA